MQPYVCVLSKILLRAEIEELMLFKCMVDGGDLVLAPFEPKFLLKVCFMRANPCAKFGGEKPNRLGARCNHAFVCSQKYR